MWITNISDWDYDDSDHGLYRGEVYDLHCAVLNFTGFDNQLPELHLENSGYGKNIKTLLIVRNTLSISYRFNATSIADHKGVQHDKFTCKLFIGNISKSSSVDLYYGCMPFNVIRIIVSLIEAFVCFILFIAHFKFQTNLCFRM